MNNVILKVEWAGPLKKEPMPDNSFYHSRQIKLVKPGKYGITSFFGKAICEDAIVELKKGDLVAVDILFHASGYGKNCKQSILFSDLIKLTEV